MPKMKSALLLALTLACGPLLVCAQQRVADPGGVVRPQVTLPPTVPPATATPAPVGTSKVYHQIDPGLNGIYADLKRADALGGRRSGRDLGSALPRPLKPYVSYKHLPTPNDLKGLALGQIVVKFVEGSGVRLRGEMLQVAAADSADRPRLLRLGLNEEIVAADVRRFGRIAALAQGKVARGAPGVDEADLDRLRKRGQSRTGREMADLNLFYYLHLKEPTPELALKTLDAIKALRSVETAYFQPLPFGAADIPPQTNIDVTASQGYFGPAPTGIDAEYARRFAGGRGNSVRIADIEAGWDDNHEDLPPMNFRIGVNWAIDEESGSHGTAVLGQLAAQENGFGANGLVPNAVIGWSSVTNFNPSNIYFYSVANALLEAGHVLRAGDIALIEQQFVAPTAVAFICNPSTDVCPCPPDGWVAVEAWSYEHAAISAVTAAGIVVVEAAGNGGVQVTPASAQDSGAIVVGAGMTSLAPFCWSNFGPRVDVQAWGGSIGTLGYGGFLGANGIVAVPSLRMNGADRNQWYTLTFGGTSGASPIVTGAAAIIQATRTARGLPKLDSVQMRSLLVSTGTPQASPVLRKIGPLPNLRAAMATYIPDAASFVQQSTLSTNALLPSSTFTVTETFKNSGGAFWTGGHTLVVAPSYQTGVQQFNAAPATLGTLAGPVGPGEEVTHDFVVTAPAQPGTYLLGFLLKNAAGQTLASSPSQTVVIAKTGAAVDNASVAIASAPNSMGNGATGQVTVNVTNTGNTTWTPASYSLRLSRFNRVSLPRNTVSLPGSVAPGATLPLSFDIICNGNGTGWFAVTMGGPSGPFGQAPGKTVVCQ